MNSTEKRIAYFSMENATVHVEGRHVHSTGAGAAPVFLLTIDLSEEGDSTSQDANSLYDKLEWSAIPLYHRHRESFVELMRYAIALNASFLNTQRMVRHYMAKAYFA